MDDLKAIDSRDLKVRLIIVGFSILAVVFAWYSTRWQIGNLLATLTQETDPQLSEVAEIATRWAPADPEGFALKAAGSDMNGSIVSLETAVRLAPSDYRWRTDLGRAYEQNEEFEKAEIQLQKAIELAPSYSFTHWHLGNFYLRRDRSEKALSELKIAAENSSTYREQVFSLLWDYSGRDAGLLESMSGQKPEMLARLAYFFAARGRAEESLRNWNRLSDADKAKNTALARAIALGLFDQKHFPQALEFARQYGAEADALPEAITNGGFEKPLLESDESRFGWIVERSDSKFEAVPDSRVKRSGNRSLRATFKGYNKAGLSNILQTVVVQPNRKYRLSFWVRTENLRSSGLPMIEVVNANDMAGIARSQPFTAGTNEWQQLKVEFAVPEGVSGVAIRTIRAFCGEDCPINGLLWYDDFELASL